MARTEFGWVYRARDLVLQGTFAVCVLAPHLCDDAGVVRFRASVQRAARKERRPAFRGKVVSLGHADGPGTEYVVLQFIEGDIAAIDVSFA
jgi:hypothetical protein